MLLRRWIVFVRASAPKPLPLRTKIPTTPSTSLFGICLIDPCHLSHTRPNTIKHPDDDFAFQNKSSPTTRRRANQTQSSFRIEFFHIEVLAPSLPAPPLPPPPPRPPFPQCPYPHSCVNSCIVAVSDCMLFFCFYYSTKITCVSRCITITCTLQKPPLANNGRAGLFNAGGCATNAASEHRPSTLRKRCPSTCLIIPKNSV